MILLCYMYYTYMYHAYVYHTRLQVYYCIIYVVCNFFVYRGTLHYMYGALEHKLPYPLHEKYHNY